MCGVCEIVFVPTDNKEYSSYFDSLTNWLQGNCVVQRVVYKHWDEASHVMNLFVALLFLLVNLNETRGSNLSCVTNGLNYFSPMWALAVCNILVRPVNATASLATEYISKLKCVLMKQLGQLDDWDCVKLP